ncbi:MAG: hypothetical protein Q4D04_08945 [Clostridia bacterium]|nr:hypothetical protein [Clostridia bacterium]
MDYKQSRIEQETSITWEEEGKKATIYTASPVTMRKLDRLAEQHPEAWRAVWVDPSGYPAKKYEVEAKYIRFGKPASEARREANRRNGLTSGFSSRITANSPEKNT